MKTDAWMPVYIGDYLGDTQRLTTEQHGAYLLLLMDYWRNGPPPADDAVLCSITRLKLARFRKHKSTLFAFFKIADGKLVHPRVDAEIRKAKQNQERRSAKASKAAEARWHGQMGDAPSNAPSNATSNAPECPPPSPSFSNEKAGDAAAQKELFSEGLDYLVRCGSSVGSARSFLGSLRKEVGDTHALALVRDAERNQIMEPKAWLTKAKRNAPANDAASLIASLDRTYGKETA
jgi:uncharacterized protein YdaU (DUF1376 family)